MSLARRLGCAMLAMLVLSMGSPAVAAVSEAAGFATVAADGEAWVTLERGIAQRALVGFAAAGRPWAITIMDAGSADALGVRAKDADVVVARLAHDDDTALLSEIIHQEFRRCGGFMWHPTREEAEAAAARANDPAQRIPAPPVNYTIDNGPVVQVLMAQAQEINVRNTILSLGNFFTRRHNCPTGLDSAAWIFNTWTALAAGRQDVTVQYFVHPTTTTPQPSVILTIQGTTLPNEVVVLGGHQDSTAGSNCSTSRSPGEDDDASGIANLTEVIRSAMQSGGGGYRPDRTVQFMAYAAEEVGLRGSADIAQTYLNQGVNVVGVLQLDMTAYRGSTSDIYIYTDFTNSTQNAFVGQLVDTYLTGLSRGSSACGYGCSDHASWHNRGYFASFPFESTFSQSNPRIHTANDTLALCCGGTADHAHKFTKLAGAYMAEVAKGGFPLNQAPVANAGSDHQASPLMTYLDGRASSDPDNGPSALTYSWTQLSGPRVTIQDATSSVARFRASYLRATYVFRLTVSDGFRSSTDDVTIVPRTEP